MAGQGTVTIKILGNAEGAIAALTGVGAKVDGVAGKFGTLGKLVAGAGIAAGVAAVGKELFDVGEQFTEAYDKIRVGTGATGAALDALKGDFKQVIQDVPTDFGKASDALTAITQKLGLTGPALDKVSEQFLELSRITKTDLTANLNDGLSALNNWNIPAAQMSMVLDQMFRASQLTGVSFDTLAQGMNTSGAQLRALGFEFGDAIAIVGQLGKLGLDVSDIMPALSKSMATAAKDGKSAGDLFQETFDAIKNAPTDVEAAGDALKVFGAKAGPKFAELIREGKLEYTDLLKSIQTGKDTILDAGKDTQNFSEKWELFKNRVLVKLEPVAIKVFDALGKAMDNLPGVISRIQSTMEPVAAFFVSSWPKVQAAVQTAVAWITDTGWPALAKAFDAIAAKVQRLVSWWKEHWQAIHDAARNVLVATVAVIGAAVAQIQFVWDHFGDQIMAVTTFVWNQVKGLIETTVRIIGDVIALFTDILSGNWGKAWDDVKDILAAAWEFIKAGVSNGVQLVIDFFGSLPANIAGALAGLAGKLRDIGLSAANAFWDALRDTFANVVSWFEGLPTRIMNALKSLISSVYSFGRDVAVNFVKGIGDAITGAINDVGDAITGNDITGTVNIGPLAPGSGTANGGPAPGRPGAQSRFAPGPVTNIHFHEGAIKSIEPRQSALEMSNQLRAQQFLGVR